MHSSALILTRCSHGDNKCWATVITTLQDAHCLILQVFMLHVQIIVFNLSTPNVNYSGRTAPLTSKVAFCIFIQQI